MLGDVLSCIGLRQFLCETFSADKLFAVAACLGRGPGPSPVEHPVVELSECGGLAPPHGNGNPGQFTGFSMLRPGDPHTGIALRIQRDRQRDDREVVAVFAKRTFDGAMSVPAVRACVVEHFDEDVPRVRVADQRPVSHIQPN